MDMDCIKFICVINLFLLTLQASDDAVKNRLRILYSDILECNHNKTLNLKVNDVQIYFYDFVNKVNISSEIDKASTQILPYLTNTERKIVFFVPGYKCYILRDIEEWIRQAFRNSDVYLIIVDHSNYSYETREKLKSYSRSVTYSYYIGQALGKLLAELTKAEYPPDNIHGVGYSLGGHMLGYAADAHFLETSQKIGRLTGLDPAGPCFSHSPIEDQIRAGVAKYVEVYHCNAGHLGTANMIADVDFVLNENRKEQPGCEGLDWEVAAQCSHRACVTLWTATVQNPALYLATSCRPEEAPDRCSDMKTTIAGYFNPGNATGVYYVSTERDSLFTQ